VAERFGPRDAGWIEYAAAANDGSLWLGISRGAWCANSPAVSLARYTQAGSLEYVSVPGLSKYADLHAFTVAPDGSLLLVMRVSRNGTLSKITEVTQTLAYWGLIGGIAVAPDGTIWYTEQSANRVAHIGTDGKTTEFRDGIAAGARPGAIAVDRDGSVWFTDDAVNTVEHLTLDGRVRIFGNRLTPWNTPGAPVVSDDGAIWFPEALSWHVRIARIDRDGNVSEFSTPARRRSRPTATA
jgi:streptogramin lyase